MFAPQRAPQVPASAAAEPAGQRGFRHLPALDGLRALGVLTVMAYHAGVSWLPGGLLGVDVFFVLSGFLITSLLLTEKRGSGRVSLRRFWGRRARRLLPAMAVLLLAMIAWAAYLSPVTARASLRGDALSTLFYVANWRFIVSGQGYFDHFGPQSPLLHTWSVAVEEQFYLVWPLLLVLVWALVGRFGARAGRRADGSAVKAARRVRGPVLVVALTGAVASAVLMAVLSLNDTSPDRLYYGTDTRALPLLLGCCLAALRPADGFGAALGRLRSARSARAGRVVIQAAGLAGFAGLVLCWTLVADRSTWLYRGGFAVVALAALGVVLSCADAPRGPLARVLSLRPLRYVGQISYGLYLYHWPVFQWLTFGRTGWRGPGLLAVRFAVTFAVAIASYHLIEQPVRRGALNRAQLKRWLHLPRPLAAAALPTLCLLLVGGIVTGLALTTQTTRRQLVAAGGSTEPVPEKQPPPPKAPELNSAQKYVLSRPVRVLIEGDSLASTLSNGLEAEASTYKYQAFNLGLLGCGVARGGPMRDDRGEIQPTTNCPDWPQIRAYDVKTYDPDVVVLLTGRWEVLDRVHDGVWTHVGEPAYDAYLASELDLAINVLSAGGAKVVLATTPYFSPKEAPDGTTYDFDDPARVDRYNALLRAAAARHPGVASVYDLNKTLDPAGSYAATIDGIPVRIDDGVHITEQGGQYVARTLGPELITLGSVRRSAQALATDANQVRPD